MTSGFRRAAGDIIQIRPLRAKETEHPQNALTIPPAQAVKGNEFLSRILPEQVEEGCGTYIIEGA